MSWLDRIRARFAAAPPSSPSSDASLLAPPLLTDRQLIASGRVYKPEDLTAMWSQAEKGDARRYYAFCDEARARDAHLDAELTKAEAFVTEARREILAFPPELREEEAARTPEGQRAAEIAAYIRSQILSPDVDLDSALRTLVRAEWKGLAALEVMVEPGGDPATGLEKLVSLAEIPAQRFAELPGTTDLGLQQGADKMKLTPVDSLGDSLAVYVPEIANPNPARRGLFRRLVALWLIRNAGARWWTRNVELFGTQSRIGKVAPGDEATEKKMAAAFDSFGNANWMILPTTAEYELTDALGAQGAHRELLDYTAREITKCVHGGTQTSQIEKGEGSKQSADTMLDVALAIANGRAKRAASFLRRTVLRGLVARNFSPEDAAAYTPELLIDVGGEDDLLAASQTLKNVSDAGVPYPVRWAYGLLGGIEVKEGEEMVEKAAPAPSPFPPGGGAPPPPPGAPPPGKQAPVEPGTPEPTPPETAAGRLPARLYGVLRRIGFRMGAEDERRRLEDAAIAVAERFEAGSEIVRPYRDAIRAAVGENGEAPGTTLGQVWSAIRHRAEKGIERPDLERILGALVLDALATGFVRQRRTRLSLDNPDEAGLNAMTAETFAASTPLSLWKGAKNRWSKMFPATPAKVEKLAENALGRARELAGVWNERFLDRIFESLRTSIENGETVKDWISRGDAILAGFAKTKEPVTILRDSASQARAEDFGAWYGDLVFRMESANSYAAGRYAEQFSPDGQREAPFWLYSAINDDRTREEHAALDGEVFRKDDPDARRFLPPWDYNCRCLALDVSADEVGGEDGYRVGRGADVEAPADKGFTGDRVAQLVPGALRELARD